MKHEVYLNFTIANFDTISHNEITQILGISPKKIYINGDRVRSNRWIMGSHLNEFANFEDQMNALLDIIEPKIDLFRTICDKYYCEFSCAVFLRYENGESIPSIHLDKRYNRLSKELKIEFDFDLYCLPNSDEI